MNKRWCKLVVAIMLILSPSTLTAAPCKGFVATDKINKLTWNQIQATIDKGFPADLMQPSICWRYIQLYGRSPGEVFRDLKNRDPVQGLFRLFESKRDARRPGQSTVTNWIISVDLTNRPLATFRLGQELQQVIEENLAILRKKRLVPNDFNPELQIFEERIRLREFGLVTCYWGGYALPKNNIRGEDLVATVAMFYAETPPWYPARAWNGETIWHVQKAMSVQEARRPCEQVYGMLSRWRFPKPVTKVAN